MPVALEPARDLAESVMGRSDDELLALAEAFEGGIDGLLDALFAEMCAKFDPTQAVGATALIEYVLSAGSRRCLYRLRVAEGACSVERGSSASGTPTVSFIMSVPDFVRQAAGKLDGIRAFLTGRWKIRGDMVIAHDWPGWFMRRGAG